MSTRFYAVSVVLFPLLIAGAFAGSAFAGNAKVSFADPEKFTDFRKAAGGTSEGREAMMADLKTHLEKLAGRWLPEGQTIVIHFTDIDLAGRLVPTSAVSSLPGRSIPFTTNDPYQRIVENVYPPYLKFDYRLLDERSGAELASGEERLINQSFLSLVSRASQHNTSALPYEKALLDQWFRARFRSSNETATAPISATAASASESNTL